jgi:hypothetical protein
VREITKFLDRVFKGGRGLKKVSLVVVLSLILLVGCSNDKPTSTNSGSSNTKPAVVDSAKTTENVTKAQGYVFEANGVKIAMNAKVEPILKSLGKEKDYFEAESCAFHGLDKTYTYSGFELHTYELDKVDYVASIVFLDDSVSTKENISLNADKKDVIKAYGDKYTEKGTSYEYQLDKSKITFVFENDKVASIEYLAITE